LIRRAVLSSLVLPALPDFVGDARTIVTALPFREKIASTSRRLCETRTISIAEFPTR
jgi:hypothetical protein